MASGHGLTGDEPHVAPSYTPEAYESDSYSDDNHKDGAIGATLTNTTTGATLSHTVTEHEMTMRQAFRLYKPAIWWACLMSLQMAMEGYNTNLQSGLIVFQPFAKRYGVFLGKRAGYSLTFQWQIGLTLGATAGGIVGAVVAGFAIEKIGARLTIMLSHVFLAGAIFIQFFAPNIQILFAGTLINGVPWGVLAMVGAIYTSEVIPTVLRGYLINFTNMATLIGHIISAGVMQACQSNMTEWSYRIPYAVQWMWPVPLFLIAYFAPDTPWWLVRRGRDEDAKKSLRRLTSGLTDAQIESTLNYIKRTNTLEIQQRVESSYADCFKGSNLRRTEIAVVALMSQSILGSTLAQSPTYFFVQAGLKLPETFKLNTGAQAIGIVGNLLCWVLMAYFGRRPLFLTGCIGVCFTMLIIGAMDAVGNQAAIWTQSVMCVIWIFIFNTFLGPQSYTIAGEISATRVRAQTMALAKLGYGVAIACSAVLQIYMINPTGWGIKGKSAWPWFAISVLYIIWTIFRLPESKDRTYEDLDILFERKISARRFASEDLPSTRERKQRIRDDAV